MRKFTRTRILRRFPLLILILLIIPSDAWRPSNASFITQEGGKGITVTSATEEEFPAAADRACCDGGPLQCLRDSQTGHLDFSSRTKVLTYCAIYLLIPVAKTYVAMR